MIGPVKLDELFSVAGKVVLVTGGSRGIGEMIAAGFLANGAKVYISSRKADACEATAARLMGEYGGECIPLPADLSGLDGAAALAQALGERETKLDVLINNAGQAWGAPFEDFPEKAWDKVMDLHVKGVFFLTQALAPKLSAAGTAEPPARVINVGSVESLTVPAPENYPYPASKAAVGWLTQVLAKRLAREHITVNGLLPGPFQSRMMRETLEKAGDAINDLVPLGRIGAPDDIAAAAIYLASPGARWLTGVNIPVDGGLAGTS